MCTKTEQPNTLGEIVDISLVVGKNSLRTSQGVLNFRTREGILLMRYVAIKMASPHRYLGTYEVNMRDLATSNRCLFFLSAMLFC